MTDNGGGDGLATKDTEVTKNGNGEGECYDNDSDTKINKGHKGKQRQRHAIVKSQI